MTFTVLFREWINFCRLMYMFQVVLPAPMLSLKVSYFCVIQLVRKNGL